LILGLAAAVFVAGLAAWLWLTGSRSTSPLRQSNVLLITLDTTRADRIGAYGYRSGSTPHLDRLAASGVRFEQAYSPAPLTLPAHASLMSGRQPYGHGVRNNGYFVLPDDVPTLAEAYAAAGYDTAAFVSAFVLDRQFGLAQGFAHYDDSLDAATAPASSLESERRGDRTVAAATEWLAKRSSDAPFFLWVHLFDAHDPYSPPSPFREQFAGRLYDGEIAFSDALVGRLLASAGHDRGETLVVVAGDHGESLGEHGESTHGLFVYQSALHVPLILSGGAITRTAVVSDPVRLIDVAPTLADITGLAPMIGAEGRSLRQLVEGQASGEEPPPLYAETYFPQFFMGWSPLSSLRAGRWKYIDAPEPELYDLSVDPGEQTNLVAREPARAQSLQRALQSTLAAHANAATPAPMSDEARQRLASLGYVSVVGAPQKTSEARGADPKHMVGVFEQLLEGNRALAGGDAEAAARNAREVVAKDGANAFARLLQGRAALALDRNHEAIAAFKEYLALVPQSADAHHWMALAALRLGDRSRALAEEEAALALDPRHTSAIALRAGLLLSMGRADDGVASLRSALARDPANMRLVIELADLLVDAGRAHEAETEYQRVLAAEPTDGRALTGLGLVYVSTGRSDAALEILTRAVSSDRENEEARFARAEVLLSLGRRDEALSEFRELSRTARRPDLRDAAVHALRGAQRK
jgi:arylsulfatase A-like enzyme/Flp pilus assembly protein TadD